jgi:hypothetical protein
MCYSRFAETTLVVQAGDLDGQLAPVNKAKAPGRSFSDRRIDAMRNPSGTTTRMEDSAMSSTIKPRYGEDAFAIGRFILDRAQALGLSRTDLVRRLGYRDLNSGHRALTEFILTGVTPPFMRNKLVHALEVDHDLLDAVLSQQHDSSMTRLGRRFWRRSAPNWPRFGRISRSRPSLRSHRRFF